MEPELLALGHSDVAIGRSAEKGTLDRLGAGLYGPPINGVDAAVREENYRQMVRAWVRKPPDCTASRALADVSAAAVLGLPLWGLSTERIAVQDFSRDHGSRDSKYLRVTSDRRPPNVVCLPQVAMPVVSPARVVVDIARKHGRIPAIAVGDYALHNYLCTRDDLHHELDLACGLKGVGRARAAVDLMNGLAESVLESRSRIEMRDLGLPIPLLQPSFFDGPDFLARVDFWWPEFLLIGEADGELKYKDGRDAAYREKLRTDDLYRIGIRMVRWNWRHVNVPSTLDARVRPMMTVPSAPLVPTARIELATPRG